MMQSAWAHMVQVDRPIHQHLVSSDVRMRSEPVEPARTLTAVHLSNVKQGLEQNGTLGGAIQKTRNKEQMGSPEHVRLHISPVQAGSVTQRSQVDPAEVPTSTQQQKSEPKLSDLFQPVIQQQQQQSESRSSQHVTQQQQQQNDLTQLTQLLIKQKVRASLPHQKITTFDGDPLKYTTFIMYGIRFCTNLDTNSLEVFWVHHTAKHHSGQIWVELGLIMHSLANEYSHLLLEFCATFT